MSEVKHGYPKLMSIKEDLRKDHNIPRMGSADSGCKKLTIAASTSWRDVSALGQSRTNDARKKYVGEAADAIRWLIDSTRGAWRYSAQGREVKTIKDGFTTITVEFRHHVQFEHQSDAMLFKLTYRH